MKFTDSHEWIKVENGIGTVGITDHAQKELGEVVYIELPAVGKQVKAGQEVAVLESTKAAADIYSPVSGEIVEINQKLVDFIQSYQCFSRILKGGCLRSSYRQCQNGKVAPLEEYLHLWSIS